MLAPPATSNTASRQERGHPPLAGLMGTGSDRGYSNTAGLASPRRPLTIQTGVSAGRDHSALLRPPLGHGDAGASTSPPNTEGGKWQPFVSMSKRMAACGQRGAGSGSFMLLIPRCSFGGVEKALLNLLYGQVENVSGGNIRLHTGRPQLAVAVRRRSRHRRCPHFRSRRCFPVRINLAPTS